MKFIPETGVLFDTLAYLTAHFAEDTAALFTDSDDMVLFESLPSLPKILAPTTTNGTGIRESSVNCQFMVNMITIIPISRNSCTTTSCVIRSINAWIVAVSPLIRLITEPVEVRS